MRILYLDIDTLRPDHLGCYGYGRNTSPNIDGIAKGAVRFDNCYCSDAPCLPSRAAMFSGRLGIHNGVVGHGGTAADPCIIGADRNFGNIPKYFGFIEMINSAGYYTVSVSPFAERHAAWWFYSGFREMFNTGKRGGSEIAKEIYSYAMPWLEKNAKKDKWFLHLNFWDPHGPYRTPKDERADLGGTAPQAKWLTKELLDKHLGSFGPHSASETIGIGSKGELDWWAKNYPETPVLIDTLGKFHKFIDGYDQGIRYADTYIGKILKILEDNGVLEDTAIIVTSDHGENIGELNVYGDHQTADYITNRIPFMVKWPGLKPGEDSSLHYQVDLAATLVEFLGIKVPARWDGKSFKDSLLDNKPEGRESLVVSNCAWSCQRAVRWQDYVMIKTFHEGLKDFPETMLFNVRDDPHETRNLATQNPETVKKLLGMLESWHKQMMQTSESGIDPMQTVLKEGGPWHTRNDAAAYAQRLTETGREDHARKILKWLKQGRYWK
ncbi:sulfatase [Candidatus Desantisbacteria bacterium CG_4_10_14_0_8_um_filter_48_22]|uniref:Sulfatase n=1 Tax=Candidatus Desantisbacteria bacterium CG_4_10_14_0_8_um_filter_48_22 TaxID=1974543 RepID=A0A2M7SFA6_9BACT|nr:MAG: hypothetical protein AUJ67_07365 [Candidatus Desantisbacteria bacterium CG1_02_49_89]PIZ17973.1 MAG: sulfatase [Candidatus Desantisbacteria bacterium CG_4_10_14_0_8_um_filter_48_22]